jgi:2-methylcitrate dehydratase PrpD
VEAIAKIAVTMRPARNWLVAVRDPADIYAAKFSLAFCMAAAALRGGATLPQFTEANLRDAAVRDFMQKVQLVDDPALSAKARIEIWDTAGARWSAEPVCRPLTHEEVQAKFVANLSDRLGGERVARTLTAVERLEEQDSVTELTGLLARPV